jgi:DNA topoisomerase-1
MSMPSSAQRAKRLAASALLRDSVRAARAAGIRYVGSAEPGIRRRRIGGRFYYVTEAGQRVTKPAQLSRIASLAIPPAWQNVWICADPDGHIQATGIDARGRKQYRYHAAWRKIRDQAKYADVIAFGHALPRLRERVARDLARRTLDKNKAIAAVVALMQQTGIRVGNDEYAASNGSYGLTTLEHRHVRVRGPRVVFKFRGKGGKSHLIEVCDRKLSQIIKASLSIPGRRLFQYVDERARYRPVTAQDVNRYLREATGHVFTAKEFRTWQGTLRAALHLCACERGTTQAAAKRALRAAIEAASMHLGNTAAICRKSYVHPAVFDAFLDGSLHAALGMHLARAQRRRLLAGHTPEERAVLAFLTRHGATDSELALCA